MGWFEQATAAERESLYDAQEFLEVDLDALEGELMRIATTSEDFLLHLLPEQMEYVRRSGPILLSGTVGSGKTTIMLYNLYWHACQTDGRYLVVSYSPQPSTLCGLLFQSLPHGREMMGRVHILSFEQLLQGFFPDCQIVPYAERRRQFHGPYQRMLESWEVGAVPKSLRGFRKRHAQFPWDEETLWGEYGIPSRDS